MKSVTVATTPTLLASAGNRDFLNIFNNDGATIFLCYDGGDSISSPTQIAAVIGGIVNTTTYTSLTFQGPLSNIDINTQITGSGITNGTYVKSIVYNIDGTVTLNVFPFIANADNVGGNVRLGAVALTVDNGWPVPAGQAFYISNDGGRNPWNKAVYAISAAGGADVRIQGA